MKRILLVICMISFILTPSFALVDTGNSWSTGTDGYFTGDSTDKEVTLSKGVSLVLNGSKERVRVGFTDHDISLSEGGEGAFTNFSTIDGVNLEVDVDPLSSTYGNSVVDEGFYISYQFVSDNTISLYLHTEEKMKGNRNINSDVEIDFRVYREQSSGPDIVFVDTREEEDTGYGAYDSNNDVYTHPNERYAWGDGIMLHVEAIPPENPETSNKGFLALHADEFKATLIATCVVES